jgi:superfamily II DNA/RNA helicase
MACTDDRSNSMADQVCTKLTPTQQLTISHIKQGKSIIVQAPANTANTEFICLQILQNIDAKIKDCQTLFITNSHTETERLFAKLTNLSANLNIRCKLINGDNVHQDIELMGYHVVVAPVECSQNLCNLCVYNLQTVVLKEVLPSQVPDMLQKTGDKKQLIITTTNVSDDPDNCQFPVIKLLLPIVGHQIDHLKGRLAGQCFEQLKKIGYDSALMLQKLTFESCVKKKSLIIQGPAGSGKTTAGVCVLLAQRLSSQIIGCQAVIITNTEASVVFIENLLSQLSKNSKMEFGVCSEDKKKLSNCSIIIGTAKSVATVMERVTFPKMHIKTIFLDDADKLYGQQTYGECCYY